MASLDEFHKLLVDEDPTDEQIQTIASYVESSGLAMEILRSPTFSKWVARNRYFIVRWGRNKRNDDGTQRRTTDAT
ncbi:MAG TPA: hypothetical protein VN734_17285 [Acidobacteriaceae bacterium]|nr:hypothetical protein [Acidobacteriaceae bacterium]